MNLRTKWKYAKMSATQGGVTFVTMKELRHGKMLEGKNVYIHSINDIDILNDFSEKIENEGAIITTKRNEAAVFINVINESGINGLKLEEVDSGVTKQLFFVCQEQKDLLLKRKGGKILNVVMIEDGKNEVMVSIKAGITNMTRGLAIATAADGITANTIFVQKSKTTAKVMGDTAVFLLSDCANDILGQVITL